jgi:arylsulfatase A-like enzyme
MKRRDFLKMTALAGASTALGTGFTGCGRGTLSKDPNRPNVIFITADDLGWRDLRCFGNTEVKTPNIDRLAKEGMMFTETFVVASSCAPSRASFITGQYPHTNGVTALTHIKKSRSLMPFYETLPSILSENGYNTALEGKWHVSPYLPTGWYGYRERLSGMLPKDFWIENSEKAVKFIEDNRENRFYLELNYMNNHRKDDGEFYFADGFPVDPKDVTVPEYWTLPDWEEIRLEVAKFYSQTMKMDSMIGDVLNKLDELGLTENTLVVFVSDNGPPFPGNKMTLYDRGTGVPLLFRLPGVIEPGTTYDGLANTIDIMPTILEACGLEIPDGVQGKSLFPILEGEKVDDLHEAVFTEMTDHVFYLPTRAARTKEWKYIRNYSDIAMGLDQNNHMEWAHRVCELPNQPWKSPRVPEELYDLKNDPDEQVNLAENPKYQEKLEEMRSLLDAHMKETKDPYLGSEFTKDYELNLEIYEMKVEEDKYK